MKIISAPRRTKVYDKCPKAVVVIYDETTRNGIQNSGGNPGGVEARRVE
jgi:hypothetical protein